MNQIQMRYPEGKPKALTLSYDDGVEQDIRLVEIMRKSGLRGTFNLNSGSFAPEGTVYESGRIHRRMTRNMIAELFRDSGMEVAVHTLTHPWLETLPPADALREVIGDRQELEQLFDRPIHGMAYPFGTFNDTVVDLLKLAGIHYSRTTISTGDFRQPADWLRLTATCHHKNPNLPELTRKFCEETPNRAPWLFYLWGHSYEFEADDNWAVIEEFCRQVSGRDDVWYATNIEVYNYTQTFARLEYAVDCRIIRNPSAGSVWIRLGDAVREIPGGATVRL